MNYLNILNNINKLPKRGKAGTIFNDYLIDKGLFGKINKAYNLKNKIIIHLLNKEGHEWYAECIHELSVETDQYIVYRSTGESFHIELTEEEASLATHEEIVWNGVKQENKLNEEWREYYAQSLLNELGKGEKFKNEWVDDRAFQLTLKYEAEFKGSDQTDDDQAELEDNLDYVDEEAAIEFDELSAENLRGALTKDNIDKYILNSRYNTYLLVEARELTNIQDIIELIFE